MAIPQAMPRFEHAAWRIEWISGNRDDTLSFTHTGEELLALFMNRLIESLSLDQLYEAAVL